MQIASATAVVTLTTNYTISGGATYYHMFAAHGAFIQNNFKTVTLSGTPAFTTFAYCQTAEIEAVGNTFNGAATGARYGVVANGVISAGGARGVFLSRLQSGIDRMMRSHLAHVLRRSANYLSPSPSLAPPPAAVLPSEPPADYHADGMRLYDKNLKSLRDPRFTDSYAKGALDAPPIEYRAYVCCWAAQQALKVPGDFVECGVNLGWLSVTICHYLDFAKVDRSFYLFDTYEGIPAEQIAPDERARAALHNYSECYETARDRFAPFPNAKLVRGRIPDSLSDVSINKVAYLSIDMNIEKPERAAIEFFWPKVSSGGIVVLDDYGFGGYEAQHNSMDEFAAKVGVSILTLPTGQGMIVKV